jgi:uncharacterized protein YbaA (DUF1428 family)
MPKPADSSFNFLAHQPTITLEQIMNYIDGFVAAVPLANKEAYIQHAKDMAVVLKEYGALRSVECWGDDVPEGQLTSFTMAVKREEGEAVVFAWVEWPSKVARDAGWEKAMQDTRMTGAAMPFDGKRMIYGGFQMVLD